MINKSEKKKMDELVEAFMLLATAEETGRFLRDLLTENELKECANRWKAARMLRSGESYADIAQATGLSSTTIARVSKWLNSGKGGYGIILERLQSDQSHHQPPAIGKGLC